MTESEPATDLAVRGITAKVPVRFDEPSHLAVLDARIGDPATSIQDAMIFTKIRGEIIKQDESRLDKAAVRRSRTHQFWGKLLYSVGAVGTGGALIAAGLHLEGFVILGAGFHWLAPDFVKDVYGRILGGKDKGDAD